MVVTWNGADVASSEDFKIDAQLSAAGARIKIALLRDGKRSEHEIVPRAAPVKEIAAPHPSSCSRTPEPLMANVDDFDVQEAPARAGHPGGAASRSRG